MTTDPDYARDYADRYGTDVWTTQIPEGVYNDLKGKNLVWSDGGNEIIQVPYRLEDMYPDAFNGWSPF